MCGYRRQLYVCGYRRQLYGCVRWLSFVHVEDFCGWAVLGYSYESVNGVQDGFKCVGWAVVCMQGCACVADPDSAHIW